MALYARDILTGRLPEPYSDERARSFARLALTEPTAYNTHHRRRDNELAAVLGLPIAEIPALRREQAALTRTPRAGRRRDSVEHRRPRRPRRTRMH